MQWPLGPPSTGMNCKSPKSRGRLPYDSGATGTASASAVTGKMSPPSCRMRP